MNGTNNLCWEETISFGACCDFYENLSKDVGGPSTGIKIRRIKKLEKFLSQLRGIANGFDPMISNTARRVRCLLSRHRVWCLIR